MSGDSLKNRIVYKPVLLAIVIIPLLATVLAIRLLWQLATTYFLLGWS